MARFRQKFGDLSTTPAIAARIAEMAEQFLHEPPSLPESAKKKVAI